VQGPEQQTKSEQQVEGEQEQQQQVVPQGTFAPPSAYSRPPAHRAVAALYELVGACLMYHDQAEASEARLAAQQEQQQQHLHQQLPQQQPGGWVGWCEESCLVEPGALI
jgi:hypothetical protein